MGQRAGSHISCEAEDNSCTLIGQSSVFVCFSDRNHFALDLYEQFCSTAATGRKQSVEVGVVEMGKDKIGEELRTSSPCTKSVTRLQLKWHRE